MVANPNAGWPAARPGDNVPPNADYLTRLQADQNLRRGRTLKPWRRRR